MHMKNQKDFTDHIYSFRALRKSIGWIGILLPFTLMLGNFLIFHGPIPLYSISKYYFTGMRDIMVGALSAISLFLFFYKGYNRWDVWTSNIAGISALCTAIFPTVPSGPLDLAAIIHFVTASIFFVTLACISFFLFTKKNQKSTGRNVQKEKRNLIYRGCGLVMFGSLIALALFYKFFEDPASHFSFWTETLALIAFGVSWLVKGGAIYADLK
jgi:hypothetical protein